jgi:hypothetical protein
MESCLNCELPDLVRQIKQNKLPQDESRIHKTMCFVQGVFIYFICPVVMDNPFFS